MTTQVIAQNEEKKLCGWPIVRD